MAVLLVAATLPALGFIRGVNLGSLFVPEAWMVPQFYADSGASSLCGFVRINETMAAARMRQHFDTFVTELDFEWLAQRGFNAVRVPIGFWNVVGRKHTAIPYVPVTAAESLAHLDKLFRWGKAHGISLLLDMHGAPGSQNGNDHSGCDSDGIGWHADGRDATLETTLEAVDVLVRRYRQHTAFLGIELLNEPAWVVEWDHGALLEYYTRALNLVRAQDSAALVVFNVLYWSKVLRSTRLCAGGLITARATARGGPWASDRRQHACPKGVGCERACAAPQPCSACVRPMLTPPLSRARTQFPAGFSDWWAGQLVGSNVVLDLHLYDCYGLASTKTLPEHLQQARKRREAIERLQEQGHAVLIGEWSLATGIHVGGQAWADAQLEAFSAGIGWFFWSYKMGTLTEPAADEGGDTW